MTEEKKQPEPTMEEILASIRRIISEDSRNAGADGLPESGDAAMPAPSSTVTMPGQMTPGHPAPDQMASERLAPLRARPLSADPRAIGDADRTVHTPYDEPVYGGFDEPMYNAAPAEDKPLDLTDTVPGASDQSATTSDEFENERVLDLTDELHDANGVMDLHHAIETERPKPALAETEPYEPEPIELHPMDPASMSPAQEMPARLAVSDIERRPTYSSQDEGTEPALLSSQAEVAATGALSRLREAADRRHEPPAPAISDEQVVAMARDRIDRILDERLAPLLRERVDALMGERFDPALCERIDSSLRQRVNPLLEEQLGPALRERLEPALREKLEPLLRERLDPMLRDWFDRNLPGIVERVVEREIERLVRHSGST
jgi:uncharacterized protein